MADGLDRGRQGTGWFNGLPALWGTLAVPPDNGQAGRLFERHDSFLFRRQHRDFDRPRLPRRSVPPAWVEADFAEKEKPGRNFQNLIIGFAASPISPLPRPAFPAFCRMQSAPGAPRPAHPDKNSTPAPPLLQPLSPGTW